MSGPGLAAMIIRDGVDYDSLDGEPVHMVFLIAAPNTEDNIHLEVLSRLSMLLMDDNFRANLMKASTVEEFLGYIDQAEKKSLKRRRRKTGERREKGISDSCSYGLSYRNRTYLYGGGKS